MAHLSTRSFPVPLARLLAGFVPSFARLCALSFVASFGWAQGDSQQDNPPGFDFFEQHIRPVLVRECYECHSVESEPLMANLLLDSKPGMIAGGDNGSAIVPGDPESSLLIDALRHREFEMPPSGKLPEETIRRFEQWVRMGAPDPRSGETMLATGHQRSAEEPWWAFQPIQAVETPVVHDQGWSKSMIDRFIWAKLDEQGLRPVADADRVQLIRRATFDLWGLPPEPVAVEAFVNDLDADAFAKVVDRLLDSPRFGERWGRHWLDIARYAESTGHERNFLYPHAWRYRDYVIAAFNQDKPYDQFVLEQLAGDQLPFETIAQRDEQWTATGFLALGSRNLIGGAEDFLLDTADDQINVTMQAILGLTVACARCHDHKFDPISTREYYGLAGIFLSTESLYGTVPGTGGGSNRFPSELIPLGADALQREAIMREHAKEFAQATKELATARSVHKRLASLPEAQLAKKVDELAQAKQEVDARQATLDKLQQDAPEPPPYAMGVRDAKKIVDTQVRISGDARKKGDMAPRGVLACCNGDQEVLMPQDASGRLQLAQWLVDPRHPLTSRVIVNRIWHHLLGQGLVSSVDNFGLNGQLPSHPELLDSLALQFQADDWSIKRTIRRIMLSHVYQLSATHDENHFQVDPDNRLLWRHSPRRLEAEAIRDAMLMAGGNLKLSPPEEGSVAARLGDGCLVREIDAEKLRVTEPWRSVYLPVARFFEPDILQVFDGASANLVVGDRAETNVPSQALFLLNNDFVIEQTQATARRVLNSSCQSDAERIGLLYQWVLGRRPTASELSRADDYLQRSERLIRRTAAKPASETLPTQDDPNRGQPSSQAVWAGLVQALFASAEFRYIY